MLSSIIFLLFLVLVSCQTIDQTITARISVSASLSFINTIGLCFFYGGLVTPKNFVSMMGQILFIYCEITCLWTFIGFTLVYGGDQSRFLGGVDNFALRDVKMSSSEILPSIPGLLFFYNSLQTAAIAPAVYTGATAERIRFSTIAILAPIWSILVFCPIAHWNMHPSGFLRDLGILTIFYLIHKENLNINFRWRCIKREFSQHSRRNHLIGFGYLH